MKSLIQPRYEVRRLPHQVTGTDKRWGMFDTFTQAFNTSIGQIADVKVAEHVARHCNAVYERDLQ